ncbi:hypothetical protein NXY33_22545 [Bacteroides fragilis]|nr:hypothetical protein [Bacteroides fragilis]
MYLTTVVIVPITSTMKLSLPGSVFCSRA